MADRLITVGEYLDQDFVSKVNAGLCVVWDEYPFYNRIVSIENKPFNADWPLTVTVEQGRHLRFGVTQDYTMWVEWLKSEG